MAAPGSAAEFYRLERDLKDAGDDAVRASRAAIQVGAGIIKNQWVANARATSGTHGKHYPNAITFETRITSEGAEGEVGPERGRPQGGMSFEDGSVNQPPHLDGQKASDAKSPEVERLLDAAVAKVMP